MRTARCIGVKTSPYITIEWAVKGVVRVRLSVQRRIWTESRMMDGWVAASKYWNKAIQTHYTNLSACLSADYTEWLAHCTPSDKVRRGGKATQPSREKRRKRGKREGEGVERQQIITWLPKRLRCALLYLFPQQFPWQPSMVRLIQLM